MPVYFKLTNNKDQTYGGCQWGPGITHKTSGKGSLCGSGWTHWYTHPLLAVLLNPLHVNFDLTTAHLWKSPKSQEAQKFDNGLKVGCMEGTTLRRVKLPVVTQVQKIAFGIFCSLKVYKEKSYVLWATNWLSGKDRSSEAARTAAEAAAAAARATLAEAATRAATRAAAKAAKAVEAAEAAWTARTAAKAAEAATRATDAAKIVGAIWVAKAAANIVGATWVAKAAARAARIQAINLPLLAKKAMKINGDGL